MEQFNSAGSLVVRGNVELVWKHDVNTKYCLPEFTPVEGEQALVDDETIYQYINGEWKFDWERTNKFHKLTTREEHTLNRSKQSAVTGIEFSSEPREQWHIGNWIAHVGGGIRSDHCVVFGSVMAVDAMIRQIIKTSVAKEKAKLAGKGLTITLSGGVDIERIVLSTTLIGKLDPIPVHIGETLTQIFNQAGEQMADLSEESFVEAMVNINEKGGITLDVEV